MNYEKDFGAFCDLMHEVAQMYKTPPMSEAGLQLMFSALEEFPLAVVIRAVGAHLKTGKFFPKPAEIREQIQGSAADRGRAAFQQVLEAIRRFGIYQSVKWPDPCIHYALDRLGGWRWLCGKLDQENRPFVERDFCHFYAEAERIGAAWDTPGLPGHFPGQFEIDNSAKGREDHIPLPRSLDEPMEALTLPEAPVAALPAPALSPEQEAENRHRVAGLMSGLAARLGAPKKDGARDTRAGRTRLPAGG